jgi:hypothetical protein
MELRTFKIALESSPYILAPAAAIYWVFSPTPATPMTVNATLVWLSPIAFATCFALSQLIWNGSNNDGCISANFGLCTKSRYEKRVCSAFQTSSCATTLTVLISLVFVRSVGGIFADLGPYDPSADGSMGDWIDAGLLILLVLFLLFYFLWFVWIHPIDQLKAMWNFRKDRYESSAISYTLYGRPCPMNVNNIQTNKIVRTRKKINI